MNNLIESKDIEMNSLEVVELINEFRTLEGSRAILTHANFMKKIRKEIETLSNVGISTKVNIYLSNYNDGTRDYSMYILSRLGMLQMCASESAIVRSLLVTYIETLEAKVNEQSKMIETQKIQNAILETKSIFPSIPPTTRYHGYLLKTKLSELTNRDINAEHRAYKKAKKYIFNKLEVTRWY